MTTNASPLLGLRILVTRPEAQGRTLCAALTQEGATVEHFPAVEICPVKPGSPVSTSLDWMIFVSANAVKLALQSWHGRIPTELGLPRIAAIGGTTARVLKQAGIPVEVMPEGPTTSESLLSMPEMRAVSGKACMIVRGEGGRQLLSDTLEGRGARVIHHIVYRRVIPPPPGGDTLQRWHEKGFHLIIVTSGEILQNLIRLWGKQAEALLLRLPLLVVSRRIATMASELGFHHVFTADGASDAALLEAVRMNAGKLKIRY